MLEVCARFVDGGQTGAKGDGRLGEAAFLLGSLLLEFLKPCVVFARFWQQGRRILLGKVRLQPVTVADFHQHFTLCKTDHTHQSIDLQPGM